MLDNLPTKPEETKIEVPLKKNRVKLFVLRLDLDPAVGLKSEAIIPKVANLFDRTEKRLASNIHVALGTAEPKISEEKGNEYVLVSDARGISLKFSEVPGRTASLVLQTTRYESYRTYQEVLDLLQSSYLKDNTNASAVRIGMRFINEFPCEGISKISRILQSRYAKAVTSLLKTPSVARAIVLIETNDESCQSRIQVGVPNQFYPARISTYDLIVDIDSYVQRVVPVAQWADTAKQLNHFAYHSFVDIIEKRYLETMR